MKVKKIRQEYNILTKRSIEYNYLQKKHKCQMWADVHQLSMAAYL